MGMFSFLKNGASGSEGSEGSESSRGSEGSNTAATATAAPAPATPAPAAINAAPSDTTFVRPAAWDAPPVDTSMASAAPGVTETVTTVGDLDPTNTAELQQPIIDAIKTVFDPEIPVDIYELGLIYDIIVDADKKVQINMTLTSPACPSAQQIPSEVRWKVKAVPGVTDAKVDIAWEPMWTKDRMSEAAKLQLGFF